MCICRVPSDADMKFGMFVHNGMCMDTMGHLEGGTIGLFSCHKMGGNQVCFYKHLSTLYLIILVCFSCVVKCHVFVACLMIIYLIFA